MNEYINGLSGRWNIKATNFPMWLSGKRRFPSIIYDVMCTDPLIVSDIVQYKDQQGQVKSIVGTDTAENNEFEWRGTGIQKLLSSRWKITGMQNDMLVIRFEKSLLTPAGIDVLVRKGAKKEDIRQDITEKQDDFGLKPEELDSLVWFQ